MKLDELIRVRERGAFDAHARLVADLLDAEHAMVSAIGRRRHHFIGVAGPMERTSAERWVPLAASLCVQVMACEQPLVVPTLAADERFRHHPAHTVLGVGSYLGVPLRLPSGEVVGAVCAFEHASRAWSEDDRVRLEVVRDHVERVMVDVARSAVPTEDLGPALRHELGGDLAVVLGGIETVRRDGVPEDSRQRMLASVHRHARRVAATLDTVMRLDPRAPGEHRAVTVDEALVGPEVRGDDPRVTLDTAAASGVVVDVDVALLRRLVGNLVGNALKHTDGPVTVSASTRADLPGVVAVRVADRGPGLPVDRPVFEPYVRGTADHAGLGLGLALVRRMSDRLGAELVVDSGSTGTAVTVLVPRECVDADAD